MIQSLVKQWHTRCVCNEDKALKDLEEETCLQKMAHFKNVVVTLKNEK